MGHMNMYCMSSDAPEIRDSQPFLVFRGPPDLYELGHSLMLILISITVKSSE